MWSKAGAQTYRSSSRHGGLLFSMRSIVQTEMRDGNPIVLMADRLTIGAYPKIASVALEEVWLLPSHDPLER